MPILVDDVSAPGDRLTIAAVAVTAYLCSVVMHEACGHGLIANLLGLHPTHVSTVDLEVSFLHVPLWKVRLVSAAGCGANLVLAVFAVMAGSLATRRSAATRYFFWLLATINILIPGGYLMVLTFPGIGDWGDFVRGLGHPLIWKSGLTLVGVGISFFGLRWGVRHLQPFLGGPLNRRRAWSLTLVPYLAGSATNTLAGALNPTSPWLILISAAAATFGGTSWLLWIGGLAARRRLPEPAPENVLVRDNRWLVAGVISILIFFFVLGPGLPR
ncbi:MAG: hypothetical protein ACRD2B_17315 [Terriglobia bacterium]